MKYLKGNIPWTKLHPELCRPNSGSFKEGFTPWNKGKKELQIAWNKGLKNWRPNYRHSEKTKEKISDGRQINSKKRFIDIKPTVKWRDNHKAYISEYMRLHGRKYKNKQYIPLSLTETEKAYIAGIIDGEGCIMILKIARGKNVSHYLKIFVKMTHRQTIEWLHGKIGGKFYTYHHNNGKNWKDCFECNIPTRTVVDLLKLIYPYLITKKKQAALALEFGKIHEWYRPLNNDIAEKREYFRQQMKILNKKGKW